MDLASAAAACQHDDMEGGRYVEVDPLPVPWGELALDLESLLAAPGS